MFRLFVFYLLQFPLLLSSSILTILTTTPGAPYEPGHKTVMRSLITGLKQQNIPFILNPKTFKAYSDTVWLICNPFCLQKLAEMKAKGKIRTLIVGPNLLQYDVAKYVDYIDVYLVPSPITKSYLADIEPCISNILTVWATGIDTKEWNCPENCKKDCIIIYEKPLDYPDFNYSDYHEALQQSIRVCNDYHLPYKRIKYGNYKLCEYKALLKKAKAVIYLGFSESQGLALLESWSCNVPTFVWQSRRHPLHFHKYCAAPYLSEETGEFWENSYELELIMQNFLNGKSRYAARKWVEKNQTLKNSVEQLFQILISSPLQSIP